MEYMTIIKFDKIDESVNSLIKDGWTPLGGVTMTTVSDKVCMAQALTRKPKAKKRTERFKKPTREAVSAFEKENNLNLEGMYDFYESNGWKVGKNSMKDWKASARNWSKRSIGTEPVKPSVSHIDANELKKAQDNQELMNAKKNGFETVDEYNAHLFQQQINKYK